MQGELLAYYRAIEVLLTEGVEHAMAVAAAEVAALGGQIHEAAHKQVLLHSFCMHTH